MTARNITTPFPVFTGKDGTPLDAGYVFIGVENLEPTTNPIVVYWDEALTIPALQPIRTINGYPSRSGTPSALYANVNYSITVKDKNSVVVYSERSVSDDAGRLRSDLAAISGSSIVGFISDVPLSQSITVEDAIRYGAINVFWVLSDAQRADVIAGTLAVDTSNVIQECLDHANGRWVYAPGGDYLIESTITSYNVSGTVHPGVRIIGDGAQKTRFFNKVASGYCFDFDHRIGSTTYADQVYSTGSAICAIGIYGDAAVADSSGIRVKGLYGFMVQQCIIRDHTEYGIHVDYDPLYNPDISASVRMLLTGSTVSYNRIGFYAPGNQACPTLTAIGCNFDWNTDLGVVHSSNYFRVMGGSISFNGYDYAGDYSPSDSFGGYLITNSATGVAAGCILDGVELDGNRPQQTIAGACSNLTITRCKFGVRLIGAEVNKYMVVFGFAVPAGVFSCFDPVFENNSITLNAGDFSGVTTFVYLKYRAGCRRGRVGANTYYLTGTGLTIGTNAFYIVEDARTGGNSGTVNALRYDAQNAYIGMTGYNVQYRSGFTVSIPDDGVVSFKPPVNDGCLMLVGGSSFTHGIIGYKANTGVTWAMATLSTGVNVGPTNTVLTGTTGTDGRLTVGSSTGTMYIENRLGSATVISLKTIIGNEFGVD